MACDCSQRPVRADLNLLNELHKRLCTNGPFARDVEGRDVSVTTLAGRPALIIDLETERQSHKSIFAYVNTGHALGLAVSAKLTSEEGKSFRVDMEMLSAHLEDEESKQHIFKFGGQIRAEDIEAPTTYSTAFNSLGIPPDLFPIHVNWHTLLACAPTCFPCRKDLVCWVGCAARCFVLSI